MDNQAIDRRRAIGTMALWALAPAFITRSAVAAAAERRAVAVPQGDWILTRIVERGLGKGARIVVRRAWRIRFGASAHGMTVTGHQVSAEVEAPPSLSALAAIERKRVEDGMFPAELDRSGVITKMPTATSQREVDEAVKVALDVLKCRRGEGQAYLDQRAFLLSVSKIAADQVSRVPTDLFFPDTATREQERDVPLAGGVTGHIASVRTASTRPGSALLDSSERKIVTMIGTRKRLSREVWSLTRAR